MICYLVSYFIGCLFSEFLSHWLNHFIRYTTGQLVRNLFSWLVVN